MQIKKKEEEEDKNMQIKGRKDKDGKNRQQAGKILLWLYNNCTAIPIYLWFPCYAYVFSMMTHSFIIYTCIIYLPINIVYSKLFNFVAPRVLKKNDDGGDVWSL